MKPKAAFKPVKPTIARMTIKTLALLIIFVALLASSCNRYITTTEAANGKARCGRMLR